MPNRSQRHLREIEGKDSSQGEAQYFFPATVDLQVATGTASTALVDGVGVVPARIQLTGVFLVSEGVTLDYNIDGGGANTVATVGLGGPTPAFAVATLLAAQLNAIEGITSSSRGGVIFIEPTTGDAVVLTAVSKTT